MPKMKIQACISRNLPIDGLFIFGAEVGAPLSCSAISLLEQVRL